MEREAKPISCNRLSIAAVTLFESVTLLRLSFHHSDATPSNPNFLTICDLQPYHDSYSMKRVKNIGF